MKLALLASGDQKREWLSKPNEGDVDLIWVADHQQLVDTKADAYFDLLFQNEKGRLDSFLQISAPLFINEVIYTFEHLLISSLRKSNTTIFRMNAWPSFFGRDIIELSSFREEDEVHAQKIFSNLGWKFKSVPDIPGLISARIIAMIINEAYYTLQEEVSTKEEIDIAMKLGTNYPYGPFEWSDMIGLENIYRLLVEMGRQDQKYQPAELLKKETEQRAAWH
jgi:3-hydroxybutyryl-CoA dehydrogenase